MFLNRTLILCVQKFTKIRRPAPHAFYAHTHARINISSLQLFRIAAIQAIYFVDARASRAPKKSYAHDKTNKIVAERILHLQETISISTQTSGARQATDENEQKNRIENIYILQSIGSDRKERNIGLGDKRVATLNVTVLNPIDPMHTEQYTGLIYEYVAFHPACGSVAKEFICIRVRRLFDSPHRLKRLKRAKLLYSPPKNKCVSFCADTPLQFFFIRQAQIQHFG